MLLQENAFGFGGILNLNAVLSLSFDPAAAIPMKWGAVYMGVFMGFWGLCEYKHHAALIIGTTVHPI